MIYGLYAIKDLKTGYLPPEVNINDLAACRNFEHACSRSETLFFTHPGDYQLWKIGTLDTDTAEIVSECKFLMDAPIHSKED